MRAPPSTERAGCHGVPSRAQCRVASTAEASVTPVARCAKILTYGISTPTCKGCNPPRRARQACRSEGNTLPHQAISRKFEVRCCFSVAVGLSFWRRRAADTRQREPPPLPRQSAVQVL